MISAHPGVLGIRDVESVQVTILLLLFKDSLLIAAPKMVLWLSHYLVLE